MLKISNNYTGLVSLLEGQIINKQIEFTEEKIFHVEFFDNGRFLNIFCSYDRIRYILEYNETFDIYKETNPSNNYICKIIKLIDSSSLTIKN